MIKKKILQTYFSSLTKWHSDMYKETVIAPLAVTLDVEWYSRLTYDYDNNVHAAMTRTSKAISGIMPANGWHTLTVSIQYYTQTSQNKSGQSDSVNKLGDQSSVQLQVFVMLSPSMSPDWQWPYLQLRQSSNLWPWCMAWVVGSGM